MSTPPFSFPPITSTNFVSSNFDQDLPRVVPPRQVPLVGERALVLGGGGSTGNAWLIGVLAGLLDSGLDVTAADLIVGTSAGSTTAAQVTSVSPGELYTAIMNNPLPQRTTAGKPDRHRRTAGPVVNHLERTNRIIAAAVDAPDMRRKMAAAAFDLDAAADGSGQASWRATTASRLPNHQWPKQKVLIPAVHVPSGEPVVFDRDCGVDLVDAVAASTSSGSPYRIGDSLYIDGGYRRNENADLAAGYERVLVLSPFGGKSRHPLAWGMQLAAQVDELRSLGSMVETLFPDSSAEHMFGANAMDLSSRTPAAQAGYDQARTVAAYLTDFWR